MANATLAENATQVASRTVEQVPLTFDAGSSVLVTLGYLSLILGVIFLALWFLRRYGPFGGVHKTPIRGLEMAGRIFLGNRQSLCVIKFGGKRLLLGVTEQQINLLASETDDGSDEEEAARPSFASFLRRKQDENGDE